MEDRKNNYIYVNLLLIYLCFSCVAYYCLTDKANKQKNNISYSSNKMLLLSNIVIETKFSKTIKIKLCNNWLFK